MKNYEVSYIKGHLIDRKSGKRIFLKRGGFFHILADDDQFEERDELHAIEKPKNEEEKLASLINEHKEYRFVKIADAGTQFVYRIGLSKKTSEDKSREFLFNAIIQEDLYIMSKNQDWGLCPCMCVTTECLEGEVQMIESVQGSSLSNLFANVVTFYFSFQRSTACNAFTTFYFSPDSVPSLRQLKSMTNLDLIRKAIMNN